MQAAMNLVVEGVRRGLNRTEAAALAGVNRNQIYRWLEGEDAVYEAFRGDLAHAEADFINEHVQSILEAGLIPNEKTGQRDWRALAWVLEHRFAPWGSKTAVELTGKGGGPIQTDATPQTPAEKRAWLREAMSVMLEIGLIEPVTENGHAPVKETT